MEIRVRRSSIYQELIISEGTATISSGLLDETEAFAIARDLISAAGELVPVGYDVKLIEPPDEKGEG